MIIFDGWRPLPEPPKREDDAKVDAEASNLRTYYAYIDEGHGYIAARFFAYSIENVEKQVRIVFGRDFRNKGKTVTIESSRKVVSKVHL